MKRVALVLMLLATFVAAVPQAKPVSAAPALRSLVVDAGPVTGGFEGADVNVTVRLTEAAPSAGARVTLTSSSPSVLPVPSSITVARGRTSVTVSVQSRVVSRNTTVTVTARFGSVTKTDTVQVVPAELSTVTLPTSVVSGRTASAKVTLNGPAPSGGYVVALASSRTSALTVPRTVTVPAGNVVGTFTVTAKTVTRDTSVTVTGTLRSRSRV